jgi:hypothetical protein
MMIAFIYNQFDPKYIPLSLVNIAKYLQQSPRHFELTKTLVVLIVLND